MTIATQLKDPSLFSELCYVDGEWVKAHDASTFAVDNPASGEIIGSVPRCGVLETEAAIAAAERAFHSWKARTAADRANLLER